MNSFVHYKIIVKISEEWHVSWDEITTEAVDAIIQAGTQDAVQAPTQQQSLTLEGTEEPPQLLIFQRLPHGLGWQMITEAEARKILCSQPNQPSNQVT